MVSHDRACHTGTFEVKLTPQPAENTLGRMSIDKQFHGDREATSQGQMLGAGEHSYASEYLLDATLAIEPLALAVYNVHRPYRFWHPQRHRRQPPLGDFRFEFLLIPTQRGACGCDPETPEQFCLALQ